MWRRALGTLRRTAMFDISNEPRVAWGCYFLLGAGVLAPWNAFITAVDYFEAIFPGRHMDRLFTVCYLPSCLLLLGLTMRYSNIITTRVRILAGFIGFTVLLVLVPLLDAVLVMGHPRGPDAALAVVLAAVVVVGVLDGLCQGAIFGDAASQPSEYTHAVVGGTASSGLLICLLRMATKAGGGTGQDSLRRTTALYFACSAAITLAGVLAYWLVMPKLSCLNVKRRKLHQPGEVDGIEMSYTYEQVDEEGNCFPWVTSSPRKSRQASQNQSHSQQLLDNEHHRRSLEDGLLSQEAFGDSSDNPNHSWVSTIPTAALVQAAAPPMSGPLLHSGSLSIPEQFAAPGSKERGAPPLRWLLPKVWRPSLSLFLLYVVTLSIFPGFLAEDVHSAELGDWYPIILITLFNAADLAGKNLPLVHCVREHGTMLKLALCRFLFLPAFVAAALESAPPTVMALLTVLLGSTNGYLTAAAMTVAPVGLPNHCAEAVENVMVFSLVGGLTAGAFLGWLWLL